MIKIFGSFLGILIFLGCTSGQEKFNEVLQSRGATQMHLDFKKISENLIRYKEKLDLRNPKAFSREAKERIVHEIHRTRNTLSITYNGQKLITYDDYLRVAFDKNRPIVERNDFLIVGLHKLLCETYQIDKGHQITTLSYQQDAFKRLYYYLEVIKWKIRTAKDKEGNYLFVTWQNNWQIELAQKMAKGVRPSWEIIENLSSIKTHKESIFDPSNPNFEILMNHMIDHAKNSARIVGDEPIDIGIDAMISVVLFL